MNSIQCLRAPMRFAPHLLASSIALAFVSNTQAQSLETVTIEGQALEVDSANRPFSLLPNNTFIKQPGASVAEKIDGMPGVAESSFSPGASRPVIRGQDADRIKILRNSSASVDASSLSPDHGVPIDPLTVKQVEITRGPAALAYGGNAVGGVVNIVDERIARQTNEALFGEITTELFGAANTKAIGFKLMAPTVNGFTLSLDAFDRSEDNLNTPDFTDPNGNRVSEVANSSLDNDGGGLGIGYTFERGYVGVSVETFNSNYGVPLTKPAELVRIDLEQERYSLEGEYRMPSVGQAIRYRLSKTDYAHQEIANGQPETRFTNDGVNGRLEWFNTLGQIGVQFEQSDFAAIGDEAFVPANETDTFGLYYLGKTSIATFDLEYGARFDSSEVSAQSTGVNGSTGAITAGAGFVGPAFNRDFDGLSLSAGIGWQVADEWRLGATLSRSERAPSSFELLADGLHIATDAYEKGNPNLSEERSTNLELTTTWSRKVTKVKTSAFYTDFSNYIGQFQRQGVNSTVVVDGEAVPVYDFQQVPAKFYGLELEASTRTQWAAWQLSPALAVDWVRAKRTDTNDNIPRQTPLRATAKVSFEHSGWSIEPALQYVARSKPGIDETRTPSYTMLNIAAARSLTIGNVAGQLYLNLINLTDELAYNANTFETVRYFTPKAGRSVNVGLKLLF